MQDVTIHITDREGEKHTVLAPTDMAMNLMEVVRSFELASEGTIGVCGGMLMCAS
jgi:2Fe-2S ferredoxin